MTIAFVGSKTAHNSTGAPSSNYTTSAGNTLIMLVNAEGTGASPSASGYSGTWTNIVPLGGASSAFVGAWMCNNYTAGAGTFSFSLGSSLATAIALLEFSGMSASPFENATTVVSASSTTATSGSLAPNNAGDLMLACVGDAGFSATYSWTNAFVDLNLGGGPPVMDGAYLVTSNTSALTASVTLSASTRWAIVLMAFAAMPAAPQAMSTYTGSGLATRF